MSLRDVWYLRSRQCGIKHKTGPFLLRSYHFRSPGLASLTVPNYCVLAGCDSQGHVDGVRKNHITLSGCPRFHNQVSSFYQELASRNKQINGGGDTAIENITTDRQYVKETEPDYDGLGTAEDIDLFRRAQQKLASDKSKEVMEHIMILSNLKSDNPVDASLSDSSGSLDPPLFTENNVKEIVIGNWEMKTVYSSAFPPDIACLPRIYICEFCLSYMPCLVGYRRHRLRCRRRFPPGNEIYRKDKFSFFEIDGYLEKEYCHNLCLVAKLYLKQKTVHEIERVPAFLFYVLTVADEAGCHIIGYFSKTELTSAVGWMCIEPVTPDFVEEGVTPNAYRLIGSDQEEIQKGRSCYFQSFFFQLMRSHYDPTRYSAPYSFNIDGDEIDNIHRRKHSLNAIFCLSSELNDFKLKCPRNKSDEARLF
ncbi:hypothetical protein ACTXT7_007365 [Hymenolepis weldensis]